MNFRWVILFCILFLIPKNTLGTGVAFLKMDVGAKASAIGSAYTALADDITAIYWNPAGLAQIEHTEFNFMHNEWFSGINYEFLAVAYPVENLTFATSITYLYMNEIDEILRDTQGKGNGRYWETGKVFTAEDMALSFALAQALEENFLIGANFKYIHQSIEDESASGYAIDLGILYKPSSKVRFGFATQNLGPNMKFIKEEFSLPLTYRLGVAYQIGKNFYLSSGVKKVKDEKLNFSTGMELWFGKLVALRFSKENKSDDKLGKFKGLPTGIAAGCGFNLNNSLTVDYTYVPYGDLGDTHQVSISMKFGLKTNR